MLVGLTLAVLASLGSGAGSAVEAIGVRRARHRATGQAEVGALLREPVYFAGLTVDLLGFAFTVLALQVLPMLASATSTQPGPACPGPNRSANSPASHKPPMRPKKVSNSK